MLPGGGDVTSRVWASIRAKIHALGKWSQAGIRSTSALIDALKRLDNFAHGDHQLDAHAWKIATDKETLQFQCEVVFLQDAWETNEKYDVKDLLELAGNLVDRAIGQGRKKAKEAFEDQLAQALRNGAGPAHKMTAIDTALPPLALTIRRKK